MHTCRSLPALIAGIKVKSSFAIRWPLKAKRSLELNEQSWVLQKTLFFETFDALANVNANYKMHKVLHNFTPTRSMGSVLGSCVTLKYDNITTYTSLMAVCTGPTYPLSTTYLPLSRTYALHTLH